MGILVVVAVSGSFFIKKIQNTLPEQGPGVSTQPTVSPVPVQKTGTTTKVSSDTYTQLVKEYEGRRIQFDINCQAIPNNITYKNGTKVMFDNRSGDARVITIGGVQYNFSGYGYKTLTLSSPVLPKTLLLSCGGAVNVGQILLQQ